MKNIIIYGNSVGVLVSAIELSKNLNNNITIINSSKNWGGYFGGILINDNKFDIGMNLFEFTSLITESNANLLNYNPNIKSESGKYSQIITEYVKNRIKTHVVKTPEIYLHNKFYDDYYISNSLDFLENLNFEFKKTLTNELFACIESITDHHAKFKNEKYEQFTEYDFNTISISNHGLTFHQNFIEPLISKILYIDCKTIPANLHRIPWAPLYYPETLLNKINNNDYYQFYKSEFEYPYLNNFACFSDNLFREIVTKKNINIVHDKILDISCKENSITLYENNKYEYDELIIGCDISEYNSICDKNNDFGVFEKANFLFIFARFPYSQVIKNFSVLFIQDKEIPMYRITNQTNLEGKVANYCDFIFEFNNDYLKNNFNESPEQLMKDTLFKLNIISDYNPLFIETKEFNNAVNLPTFNNIKLYNQIKSNIKLKDNINYIGNINSLFSNSFNDNIIQALQIIKKINI
jgi:hypothetical protein